MKPFGFVPGGIAVLLLLAVPSHAQMYKWVDKDGVVHFQDTPPQDVPSSTKIQKIPAGEREPAGVRAQEPPGDAVQSPAAADNAAPAPRKPAAVRKPVRLRENPKVEIYGTSWCPYCKMAREFFRSRNIPFDDYDVERDYDAAARKKALDPTGSGVPVTVIDGQVLSGFSEDAYLKALEVR